MFLFSLYMRQTEHKSSLPNVKFGNIQADQSENTTSRLLSSLCFSKTTLNFLSVLSFIRFFFEFLLCRFGFFFQKKLRSASRQSGNNPLVEILYPSCANHNQDTLPPTTPLLCQASMIATDNRKPWYPQYTFYYAMLLDFKITKIFFVIDEFSQVFDATMGSTYIWLQW